MENNIENRLKLAAEIRPCQIELRRAYGMEQEYGLMMPES